MSDTPLTDALINTAMSEDISNNEAVRRYITHARRMERDRAVLLAACRYALSQLEAAGIVCGDVRAAITQVTEKQS